MSKTSCCLYMIMTERFGVRFPQFGNVAAEVIQFLEVHLSSVLGCDVGRERIRASFFWRFRISREISSASR